MSGSMEAGPDDAALVTHLRLMASDTAANTGRPVDDFLGLVDGWTVATQGHYFLALHRTFAGIDRPPAGERIRRFAEDVIALHPPEGEDATLERLRRWCHAGHCRSCSCPTIPGKLGGVLLNRKLLAQAIDDPLPGTAVRLAPGAARHLIPDDSRASGGTHIALFALGWRVVLMGILDRDAAGPDETSVYDESGQG